MIRISEVRKLSCASCRSTEGVKGIYFGVNRECDGVSEILVPLCEHCRRLLVAEVSDDLNGYICEPKEEKK